jgi:hypothetical protein
MTGSHWFQLLLKRGHTVRNPSPELSNPWLGRGQAPYSLGSAYLFLPVSFGSASIAEP